MDNYTINTKQEYIKYKSGIWYLASEILKDYNIENTGTNQYKLYVWIKKQNKLKDSDYLWNIPCFCGIQSLQCC